MIVLDLPITEEWKAELTMVTGYIPRWFTRPQTVTRPITNPAVHGRDLNSQHVDHKSDALTTTPLSHPINHSSELKTLADLLSGNRTCSTRGDKIGR